MKRNNRFSLKTLAIIAGAIIMAMLIGRAIIFVASAIDESTIIPTTSRDENNLVSSKYTGKLGNGLILQFKQRNPVVVVSIDSNYRLVSYKIDLREDIPWNQLLTVKEKGIEIPGLTGYHGLSKGLEYEFMCRGDHVNPVAKIFLTISGKAIQRVIQNDSIISYSLICKSFSIKYEENGQKDIVVSGENIPMGFGAVRSVPMNLLFLKRGNAAYLTILNAKDLSEIKPDLLNDIIVGK
ncbi:hypothetical protein [Chitinophaga sp. 212800010-3]|uniref:hypothetical protein n=1 Tax=unclassified Chitinophaga TaxID=2619133 RepID=UPI002DF5A4D3|nr:hypothetical protein [Chitinophaga sp. 212800010-3]